MRTKLPIGLLALTASFALVACETSGQSGAAGGAALGALAGQVIGGDTEATLLGAAIGAGAGYMVGNEKDKKEAEMERQRNAQPAAPVSAGSAVAAPAPAPAILAGTRWQIVSLVAAEPTEYVSKLVDFTASEIICTTTLPDGTVTTEEDRYQLVGNAMIITRPDSIINAEYSLNDGQLIVNCNEFRAVLKKI